MCTQPALEGYRWCPNVPQGIQCPVYGCAVSKEGTFKTGNYFRGAFRNLAVKSKQSIGVYFLGYHRNV